MHDALQLRAQRLQPTHFSVSIAGRSSEKRYSRRTLSLLQMRAAVILHKRRIVGLARIGRVERQMVVVILQRLTQQTLCLRLAADIFDLVQRRAHIAERDIDPDLVIGDDQRTVVRDIVDGVRADRILARKLVHGGGKILLDVAGILARMDHAMLHAVLHERPQGVLERLIIANRQHVALRLGLCARVVRGHKGVGGRDQPAAPAQGCQQQSKRSRHHPAFQSSPSLPL